MLIGMNQPLQCHRYRRILLAMMTYKDGIEYATDYEFSLEQLADIKPEHIYKWMAVKTYGKPNPSQNDNPTYGRSTSLEYYKKALSYFNGKRVSVMPFPS